jgi:hypothetical protein
MKNRKGAPAEKTRHSLQGLSLFYILFSVFCFLAGCGAPGEPRAPSPQVPAAIADLSASQDGDGVQLSFSLPSKSISGESLSASPAVEILRGTLKPDGAPDSRSFRVVDMIPGALIDNYRSGDHLQVTDPIVPEETKAHPGGAVAYMVRTRVSQKRASADSNVVFARVYPVPARIASVEARLTESAIELSWAAPVRTSAGDPLSSALTRYRIYRAEAVTPSAASSPPQVPSQGKREPPSASLATVESSSYSDTSFNFDRTYIYTVRSVIQVEGQELESSASGAVTVAPRDTFPPAAPQGLVAALLPGATPGTFVAELSWSINLETDLAGYRVYRSEQENVKGQLLTVDLLLAPADRDTSVERGHRYWYTVTAVDRAGNESAPSTPAAIDLTQLSP